MITFIISLILITNQNDLKGFENKETAEYYAKIIGCEGYFESNINGSTYFFPCQNKDELQAIMQRREIEPKVTELWDPEPKVVELDDDVDVNQQVDDVTAAIDELMKR